MLKRSMWTRVVCLLSAGIFLSSPTAYPLAPPSRLDGLGPVFSRKVERRASRNVSSAVKVGGQVFTVTVVERDDGTQRIELNRKGRVKPKNEPPDLFAYSFLVGGDPAVQGLRGVYIDEELRGKELLRPILNLFFSTFPGVQRTHPNLMDPVVLDLLVREYGFLPAGDVAPNAFFGRIGERGVIYFADGAAEELFYSAGISDAFLRFRPIDVKTPGLRPVHLGEPLVLKALEESQEAAEAAAAQA